jgi:hypothetical protein
MSEEELSHAYKNVESIDTAGTAVPNDVIILSMINAEDKATSFFDQGGQVCGFNGTRGFVVWNLERSGVYWVFCQMAAQDARPLCLSSNDEVISNGICDGVTGSWRSESLQWFHHGPFELKAGSVKIDTDGYWPHVKRFVLIPTATTPQASPSRAAIPTAKLYETPKLSQPSHALVSEKLASIPDRAGTNATNNIMVALRQPKNMSDKVHVGDTMIVVNGTAGYYEFEFVNEVWAEQVYLDVTYASGDSRPVTLSLNDGDASEEGCCAESTGGFATDNFVDVRCGPFPIHSEVNTIKVETKDGYFPHIGEVRVVNADTGSEEVTKRSIGTWIVPPSAPLRDDLPPLDFCFVENTQDPNPNFEPDPDFYNGINLDGFWVLASKQVEKRVLNQAAELLSRYIPVELRRLCLKWRAPKGMPQGPFRLVILDPVTNQQAGDCPDFPSSWGGRNGTSNPGIFTSADDFSLNPRSGPCGSLTVHEVTHGLDMVIRQQLDPYFFEQTDDCYRAAMERQVYRKAYAAANRHEYLAEICMLFVGTCPTSFSKGCFQCTESDSGMCDWKPHSSFPPGKGGVDFTKKSHLIENDPRGYELLKSFLVELKDPKDDSFWWE